MRDIGYSWTKFIEDTLLAEKSDGKKEFRLLWKMMEDGGRGNDLGG